MEINGTENNEEKRLSMNLFLTTEYALNTMNELNLNPDELMGVLNEALRKKMSILQQECVQTPTEEVTLNYEEVYPFIQLDRRNNTSVAVLGFRVPTIDEATENDWLLTYNIHSEEPDEAKGMTFNMATQTDLRDYLPPATEKGVELVFGEDFEKEPKHQHIALHIAEHVGDTIWNECRRLRMETAFLKKTEKDGGGGTGKVK